MQDSKQKGFCDAVWCLTKTSSEVDAPKVNDYSSFQDKLKKGDIIVASYFGTKVVSPLSRIIGVSTKSPWTHAGMYLGDGRLAEISFGLDKKTKLFGKGDIKYRERSINSPGYKVRRLMAVRPKVQEGVRETAAERMQRYGKNIKFSYKTLVKNLLPVRNVLKPVDKNTVNSGVCTTAVAVSYPTVEFRPGYSSEYIRPKDLLNEDVVEPVVEYVPEAE
jgi:hypothetical protein